MISLFQRKAFHLEIALTENDARWAVTAAKDRQAVSAITIQKPFSVSLFAFVDYIRKRLPVGFFPA
jgi:hypothetical protein